MSKITKSIDHNAIILQGKHESQLSVVIHKSLSISVNETTEQTLHTIRVNGIKSLLYLEPLQSPCPNVFSFIVSTVSEPFKINSQT